MRPVRLLVLLAATLLAALFVIPSAVAGTPAGASAAPALTVSPSSGPVGTKVTVQGQGCANPGAETVRLVFQSGPGGTTGAVDFGEIPVDGQGRFRTRVTIPAELDPLQGVGGGPTQPGSYVFVTRPPICTAAFTVTGQAPAPPAGTVTVTRFSCASVTVKGSGWEQTDATVAVAVRPVEGGGSREDFVAGPVQVFPDVQGNIAPTTLRFASSPPDGQYVAVVLVDFIERGQSAAFTLRDCGPGALPFTGSATVPSLIVGLAMVAGGLALVHRTRTS